MRQLRWVHRGWVARRWDLVEGERVVATLEQRGWSGWGADVAHGARRLRVEVKGALRWSATARDESGAPVATLPLGWRGQGVATLPDGRAFRWDADDFWGRSWTLEGPRGRVARVRLAHFLRMDADIEVEESGLQEDELVALLGVTWMTLVVTTQAAVVAGG